jgi:hypothetical protein
MNPAGQLEITIFLACAYGDGARLRLPIRSDSAIDG